MKLWVSNLNGQQGHCSGSTLCISNDDLSFKFYDIINMRKVPRKHSLHRGNSRLGFIEAVHQW